MATYLLLLLVGLQTKHFVADYLLQTRWMLAGKASFRKPGGYCHVGVHAVGSLIVLILAGVPAAMMAVLLIAEAVVHYLIDFGKAAWSRNRPADITSAPFWAAHGADQLLHQITYAVMVYVVLTSAHGM
ncbi:hypothetical protein MesoLjLc_61680 [Mesorhizobium sp. L-8-10]|uniref:DUF3307 domain-containing protein n=1 Tax=unclassified Mesorhizobium TaxID=325217 RepID=UPI00192810CC|nr:MULTISPECIES: DUF3307 domain-containing protein [unclassified Mesorhizobium]BCH26249.1 hypothetical protein MesoLjLb_60340 [Mesorhizobium sp. L-8-3]BCH34238.1 hypothetical protein MesoLjLc_61680 [Mesorhizobium sp. L-8-10]